MPGNSCLLKLKCEPSSEEDDIDFQYQQTYKQETEITELRAVKSGCDNESQLLERLQTGPLCPLEELAPPGPAATPVAAPLPPPPPATLATLQAAQSQGCSLLDRHRLLSRPDDGEYALLAVKEEPLDDEAGSSAEEDCERAAAGARGSKAWRARDMDAALRALRSRDMSLTKASLTYGIPSTTLWQRAHRLGIHTPKKDGGAKSWSDADLRRALHALRTGATSANKASKAYGIPSSTLYKIARREGIRLAAPFNAAPTAWRRADLTAALQDIRRGHSVQTAAQAHGIPTGTLYGRCKREGIELSRANPTPWSEDAMGEALIAVRVGQMSINQAAIHYNLPYSSLYGRFKRCNYTTQSQQPPEMQNNQPDPEFGHNQPDADPGHNQPDTDSSHNHNQPSPAQTAAQTETMYPFYSHYEASEHYNTTDLFFNCDGLTS